MVLKNCIPNDFYKLFRTKNREYYIMFLEAIYDENNEAYNSLGLTEGECKAIINENILRLQIEWQDDEEEEDNTFLEVAGTPAAVLLHMVRWGWLKKDFDDRLNAYVLSFPEYSQLFVELFKKLLSEDDSRERESILAVYSALHTYCNDDEQNNDILRNALRTSKSLGLLLSNMQDGMRNYFDVLSQQKDFIGIQEVLINEINNSDSKKYEILTTTDSFYRYKENVKELIINILNTGERTKRQLEAEQKHIEKGSGIFIHNERKIKVCDNAIALAYQIEHEFDIIEKKYNKLIEQKTIFASRAAARIRYILQEGSDEEDNTVALISLLGKSDKKEEILNKLSGKIRFSTQFTSISDNSFYSKRERLTRMFHPEQIDNSNEFVNGKMEDFILKPLYTRKQIKEFMNKNTDNGVFKATKDTVHSIDDLEKLLFLWQSVTQSSESEHLVELKEKITTEEGYSFSGLLIKEGQDDNV